MGIQVSRRISFQHTHDTIWDLSYVCFQLILQAKSFVFVLFCGIQVASMPSVDSIPYSKRCSHISMWLLILSIIEVVILILFIRCASLQVDPIISTSARSPLVFSQCCSFHLSPSCLCFSTPPPFSSRNQISYSSIHVIDGSLSILFFQCSHPVILMKILMELQVRHSSLIFLLRWFELKRY